MKKKFVAAFLAVCMLVTMLVIPANAASKFEDIEGNWAADAIERWADYGVLNGVNEEKTIYEPDRTMTRAEFAKVIVSIMGYTEKTDPNPFTDIDNSWAKDIILMANKAGVVTGDADKGLFMPQNPVTGEQIAMILCRATGLMTKDDTNLQDAVTKLVDMGLISADDENMDLGAKVEANRAIVAALTNSLIEEYIPAGTEKTLTNSTKGVVVVAGGKVTIEGDVEIPGLVVSSNGEAVADENTKIGAVVMTGTEPTADLKGAVDSITITEGTTGAEAVAPKVDSANVTNNSTEDATINDSTVAGVEDKTETPDDGKTDGAETDDETATGGPVAGHTHKWEKAAAGTDYVAEEVKASAGQHIVVCKVLVKNAKGEEVPCGAVQVQNCTYTAKYVSTSGHNMVCTLKDCTNKQVADKTADGDAKYLFEHTAGTCACGYKVETTGTAKCPHESAVNGAHDWYANATEAENDETKYKETSASCTKAKTIFQKCKNCVATQTITEGVPNEHTWASSVDDKIANNKVTNYADTKLISIKTKATCTEKGVATVKCSECEKATTEVKFNALGHDYTDATVFVKVSDSQHKAVCVRCNDKSTSALKGEAVAHTFEYTYKNDSVDTGKCTGCGFTKDFPHTGAESNVKAGTCTERASKDVACTQCEKTVHVVNNIDPDNHVYKPSLAEAGLAKDQTTKLYHCACGNVLIDANNNVYTETGVIDPSTCDHTFEKSDVELSAATCVAAKKMKGKCSVCGYMSDDAADAFEDGAADTTDGHSYDQGEVTTLATCTTDGEKTYTCSVCGSSVANHTKTETLNATGHDWSGKDGVCKNDSSHACTDGQHGTANECPTCGMPKPADP